MIWEFLQLTNKMTVLSEGLKIWGEGARSNGWDRVNWSAKNCRGVAPPPAPQVPTALRCVHKNAINFLNLSLYENRHLATAPDSVIQVIRIPGNFSQPFTLHPEKWF